MVSRSDEFVLSTYIGQALVKNMMIEMCIGLTKKPVPPESTMSIIEWLDSMQEEAEQHHLY